MAIRKRLQARNMHGEQYGKLDSRHLARVATDQRIFRLRFKFPDGFPSTRILLDLSGSMDAKQREEVLAAAAAMQVLIGAEIWCYAEYMGVQVSLVRVDDGKLVHVPQLGGFTPSGLAITGVSIGMKRNGLIIHLTDGGSNVYQSPILAHNNLVKRGIGLVNVMWPRTECCHKDYRQMNTRRIRDISEFPDALYGILMEQAKLGLEV
jgi:hypothetical protein